VATQARTRFARRAVIEAARTLFLERGYGATTIDAISAAADVPPATVYRLFSSKRGILKALLDVSIAGDDDTVPVVERPQVQSLLTDEDPARMVARFVHVAVEVNARTASIYRILTSAAASDADAATLLDELTTQRQQGQGSVARALARQRRALRRPLRERDAGDIIHALASPELYQLLVVGRNWKPERYEQWLTETLCDQLLAAPHDP
jgi:TetR/AcrR family transcriptional regulator, regulator of autoinduction and epiphytic fitness